jgi:hypothetical protein
MDELVCLKSVCRRVSVVLRAARSWDIEQALSQEGPLASLKAVAPGLVVSSVAENVHRQNETHVGVNNIDRVYNFQKEYYVNRSQLEHQMPMADALFGRYTTDDDIYLGSERLRPFEHPCGMKLPSASTSNVPN